MKRYLAIILCTLMINVSCSQKPEDIKISDLKTPCDHLDALEKVIDAIIKIKGTTSREDLSQKDIDYLEVLFAKAEEIGEASSKKYTSTDVENCPNSVRYMDKLEKLENEPPIKRSGKSDLEKKVETYIIEETNHKFYHTIEFGIKKVFNLEQLIQDYKIPEIFYDEPKAFKDNEEAFESLKTFSKEVSIAYSMTLDFALKNKYGDAWDSYWVIVLFDSDLNIIGHFYYAP